MENKIILMIEDNAQILHTNREMLTRLSCGAFDILTAESLSGARPLLTDRLDLILLDILLPDGSGLDFVPEIRAATSAPILMLTSRREPEQIVEGLMGGGDEYMTKPYRMDELFARVTAILRREDRHKERPPEKVLARGTLTLEIMSARAAISGADMGLTRKEFSLLLLFVQSEGKAVSAELIYHKVWGQPMAGDGGAVKNAVYKLRKKLLPAGYSITNIRGEGYVFEKQ